MQGHDYVCVCAWVQALLHSYLTETELSFALNKPPQTACCMQWKAQNHQAELTEMDIWLSSSATLEKHHGFKIHWSHITTVYKYILLHIYRIFRTIRHTFSPQNRGWKVCVSYGAKKTDYIFLFSSPKKLVRLMERCVLWSEKYGTPLKSHAAGSRCCIHDVSFTYRAI